MSVSRFKPSFILIRPEPDDYLEPNEDMTISEAAKLIRPFLTITERNQHDRWFQSMDGYAGKKYVVTGLLAESADSMMEYEIIKEKEEVYG